MGWFPEVLRGGWGIYPTYTLNPLKSVKNPIICKSLIINQLYKTTKIVPKLFGLLVVFSYLYIYQTNKGYGLPS